MLACMDTPYARVSCKIGSTAYRRACARVMTRADVILLEDWNNNNDRSRFPTVETFVFRSANLYNMWK